jgi:PII-like signaling protein
MTFQTMCALRVYLRQGDSAPPRSILNRLFRRPLATHLLQAALKAGVTHASLSLGHMGFARGAKVVSMDISDIPVDSMPACVELVGPKQLLEQFVRDHVKLLADATLVMLEGVHVVPRVVEGDLPATAHHVEYVRAGGLELPVEHVELGAPPAREPAKPAP